MALDIKTGFLSRIVVTGLLKTPSEKTDFHCQSKKLGRSLIRNPMLVL